MASGGNSPLEPCRPSSKDRRSSSCGYAQQRAIVHRVEENDSLFIPRSTSSQSDIANHRWHASSNLDPFELAPAKKPSDPASGDQKGNVAPSVPGSSRAIREFKGRTQSLVPPEEPVTNAIVSPSGEIAAPVSTPNSVPRGGLTVSLTARFSTTSGCPRWATVQPSASPTTNKAAATPQIQRGPACEVP